MKKGHKSLKRELPPPPRDAGEGHWEEVSEEEEKENDPVQDMQQPRQLCPSLHSLHLQLLLPLQM